MMIRLRKNHSVTMRIDPLRTRTKTRRKRPDQNVVDLAAGPFPITMSMMRKVKTRDNLNQ